MNRVVHISSTFDELGGASISAAERGGVRLCAGQFDWKRKLVRCCMRCLGAPMDVSAGIISCGIKERLYKIRPSHVFIHWIGHEMLRYEELVCLKDIKTTIVLHDFSLFEAPPYRHATWFDRWRLKRIRKVLNIINPDYEAPSLWAAKHLVDIVPNATVVFRPTPVRPEFLTKQKRHGSSDWPVKGKFKILFGCHGGRSNPYKGFGCLEKSLDLMSETDKKMFELHIFGEQGPETVVSGVRAIFHGVISDPIELSDLYRECDVLAFPSLSETQGLVKDEALACGLKVVAFDRAACAEGLQHRVNGYVAKDLQDFADGLVWAVRG